MSQKKDNLIDVFFSALGGGYSLRRVADHLILIALSISEPEVSLPPEGYSLDDKYFLRLARKVCEGNSYLADVFFRRLGYFNASGGMSEDDRSVVISFADFFFDLAGREEFNEGIYRLRGLFVDRIIYGILSSDLGGGSRSAPEELLDLLCSLAILNLPRSIYDPRCNSAQALINISSSVDGHADLVGQCTTDLDLYYANIRALAYGVNLNIAISDAIRSPLAENGQLRRFDLIVSDLSSGIGEWASDICSRDPYHRFIYGAPSHSRGEYAYLLHMIASTRPGGRSIAIVNPSILSRLGRDADIRKSLINESIVESVIFLPQKLFRGDARPLAIITANAGRQNEGVLLINASSEFEAGKSVNRLTSKSIDKILEAFKWRLVIEGYSKIISRSELAGCDFALSLARHFSDGAEEIKVDSDVIFDVSENIQSQLAQVGQEIDSLLKSILKFD